MSHALPLGLLVHLEVVLVEAPVIELGGPLPPPGNILPAIVAPSDVRL